MPTATQSEPVQLEIGFARLTPAERAVIAAVEPMIAHMTKIAVRLTDEARIAEADQDVLTAARIVMLLSKLTSVQVLLDDVLDAAHREGQYEECEP